MQSTVHRLTRSMKKIGRSVGRSNPSAIARQVMAHSKVKEAVIKVTGSVVRKEMKVLCKRSAPSILRDTSPKAMQSFKWDTLIDELKMNAPTLLQILQGCTRTKRRGVSTRGKTYTVPDNTIIGLCAAILLCHRNTQMNLVQRIISVLLYSGHTPKQVC